MSICVILYSVKPDTIASRGGYYGLINIEIVNGKMHVVSKYNQKIVSFMRQQPGKFWDANKREWIIPESSMPGLLNLIDDLGEEYNIVNKDESTKVHVPIPENYVFKTEPYKHQIEGVEYGLDHPKFLLSDEQGLGKSKQVIDLASIYKQNNGFKHVLVIACVNGLKYNWRKEVSIHSDETGYILGTRYTKKGREYIGSNQDRLDDLKSLGTGADIDKSFFIITNIETLRYSKSVQVPMKRKKNGEIKYKKQTVFPIVEEINRLIKDGQISMVIVDEMHRCFSYDTKILTDIGFMNIGDVVNSRDRLVATRSDTGSIDFVKPSNYFKNPISNLMLELTVMLSSGRTKTIVCTPDHMFLTDNRGYVSANELSENDILVEGEIE